MGGYTGECATIIEVMDHVQDESIVSFRFRSQCTRLAETVVGVEFLRRTPLSRERRICNYGIKLPVGEGIRFECVAVLYGEIFVLDTMKQHIHSGKVERGGILFLSINGIGIAVAGCPQKKGAGTASRVIYIAQTCLSGGYYLGENLTDFLRSVKLTGLFAGTGGKLTYHILVGIAENVDLGSLVKSEVYAVESDKHVGYERIFIIGRLSQLR